MFSRESRKRVSRTRPVPPKRACGPPRGGGVGRGANASRCPPARARRVHGVRHGRAGGGQGGAPFGPTVAKTAAAAQRTVIDDAGRTPRPPAEIRHLHASNRRRRADPSKTVVRAFSAARNPGGRAGVAVESISRERDARRSRFISRVREAAERATACAPRRCSRGERARNAGRHARSPRGKFRARWARWIFPSSPARRSPGRRSFG